MRFRIFDCRIYYKGGGVASFGLRTLLFVIKLQEFVVK